MDIQEEVRKIMIDGIQSYARTEKVDKTKIKLLLGFETYTKSLVLVKKEDTILGRASLISLLGLKSLFYSKINDYIVNALKRFSEEYLIANGKANVEISCNSNNDIRLWLCNGFEKEGRIKEILVDDIINSN